MKVVDTALSGVKLIEPRVFGDDRGFFLESWNSRTFTEAGLDLNFVQDNHSRSARHVLRGLHYQLDEPQGKLVRVTIGRVLDVAVDLRRSSPSFGRWAGFEMSADNKRMLWVPPGFAHGFVVTGDDALFSYKCTEYYSPATELTLLWDDPALGIDWQTASPTLSDKDKKGVRLADIPRERLPLYQKA